MQTVDQIIAAHSMTLSAEMAETNPVMPQDGSDLDHWLCRISAEGVEGFDVHVSLGSSYNGVPPDLEMVLALVLEDVRAFRNCSGYTDFTALLGIDEGEDSPEVRAAWEALARVDAALKPFWTIEATPSAGV